jgi:hypothetical protein
LAPGAAAQLQQLDRERGEEPDADDEDSPQHTSAPAQAKAEVALAVRHEAAAAIDDEHLVLWDDGDDRRRRHPPHAPMAHPNLEYRRIVRVAVRENPFHRAVAPTCERESDAVGEPVAGDGAPRVEPPALAQCNRHHAPVPHNPAMRNSSS